MLALRRAEPLDVKLFEPFVSEIPAIPRAIAAASPMQKRYLLRNSL